LAFVHACPLAGVLTAKNAEIKALNARLDKSNKTAKQVLLVCLVDLLTLSYVDSFAGVGCN